MRFNGKLFYVLTAFYALAAGVYFYWSTLEYGTFEVIGTAAIAMLAFMSIFLAFYLQKTAKSQGDLPEDQLDAKIEDGDSEIGFFSPWSWWPFILGAGASTAFASLAIGWWLFILILPVAFVAIIGFVFEYSRGQHAH